MIPKRSVLELLIHGTRIPANSAKIKIPNSFGYYAIYVDEADALPEPFSAELKQKDTNLVYLGIANKRTLQARLLEEDLQGKGHSTFFRGIGTVLGFKPPPGSLIGYSNQNNYTFTEPDKLNITKWINVHLSVTWVEDASANAEVEKFLIDHERPLFNWDHNPERSTVLREMRRKCRERAKSLATK